MIVRSVKPSDTKQITKWLNDPTLSERLFIERGREAEQQTEFWATPNPQMKVFVVESDKKPVGIAICSSTPYYKASHWTSLTLLIDPKKNGKGAGSALLDEVEAWCKKRSIERIVTELYESPHQGWFEKRGFTPFAKTPAFLKIGSDYKERTSLKKELV